MAWPCTSASASSDSARCWSSLTDRYAATNSPGVSARRLSAMNRSMTARSASSNTGSSDAPWRARSSGRSWLYTMSRSRRAYPSSDSSRTDSSSGGTPRIAVLRMSSIVATCITPSPRKCWARRRCDHCTHVTGGSTQERLLAGRTSGARAPRSVGMNQRSERTVRQRTRAAAELPRGLARALLGTQTHRVAPHAQPARRHRVRDADRQPRLIGGQRRRQGRVLYALLFALVLQVDDVPFERIDVVLPKHHRVHMRLLRCAVGIHAIAHQPADGGERMPARQRSFGCVRKRRSHSHTERLPVGLDARGDDRLV